jgi:hypothetical protein
MAFYTIVPHDGGKFGVEIDEGGEKPITLGPFDTELAAQAAIDEQKRMAAAGERWARTPLGRRLDKD